MASSFKRHISVASGVHGYGLGFGIPGIRFSFYLLGAPITYTHAILLGLVMSNGSGTRPRRTHVTAPLVQFGVGKGVGLQWAAIMDIPAK